MREFMRTLVLVLVVASGVAAAENNVVREGSAPANRPATLPREHDGSCAQDYVKLDAPPLCVLGPKLWNQADQETLATVYYEVLKREKIMSAVFSEDWNLVREQKQQEAWTRALQRYADAQRSAEIERERSASPPTH